MWNLWKRTSLYDGEAKEGQFDYLEISSYFCFDKHTDVLGVLSDQTCSDLGFDEVFMYADRTVSRIGQQYLYNLMRTISEKPNGIERNESLIRQLASNKYLREEVVKELQVLSSADAEHIRAVM